MARAERGSAFLALRARALAKFDEVDTVPVRENNPFKIEKKTVSSQFCIFAHILLHVKSVNVLKYSNKNTVL